MSSINKAIIAIALFSSATTTFATDQPLNRTRDMIFLVTGYPSNTVLSELTNSGTDCSSEGQSCPPQNGILGTVKDIFDAMLAAQALQGRSNCTDLPTSGTLDITVSGTDVTLTHEATTKTIPTGMTGAGTAFTKRITAAIGTNSKVAMDFSCTSKVVAFEYIGLETSHRSGNNVNRVLSLYLDSTTDNTFAEVYMTVRNSSDDTLYDSQIIRLQLGDDSTFKYWIAYVWSNTTTVIGERVFINGNYSTRETSTQYIRIKGTGSKATDLTGTSQAPLTASLNNTWSADLDSTDVSSETAWQGCIDYDTLSSLPTSTDACTGAALEAPTSAPVVDANGSFTYTWLNSLTDSTIGVSLTL